MSNVSTMTATRDDDRLVWLRNVLTAIMEVAPVSYQQKKKASQLTLVC